MKKSVRIVVDIIMYFLFLYLMSYRAGRGLSLHGILGCVLFALFLLHHIINLGWYGGLGKGKYRFIRIVFASLDFVLLADMLLMAVSSVMMSGDVFEFSPFISTQFARNLHIASTAWGFVLTVIHMGLHSHTPLERLRRKISTTFFGYAYYLFFFLVLSVGVYCFIQSSLWKNMLLMPKGNPYFQPLSFYGQYGMITLSACQLTHLFLSSAAKIKNQHKEK